MARKLSKRMDERLDTYKQQFALSKHLELGEQIRRAMIRTVLFRRLPPRGWDYRCRIVETRHGTPHRLRMHAYC